MFKRKITANQAKDAGMALTLIFLFIGLINKQFWPFKIAFVVLIINMAWSKFYYPFAVLWYGLADILGKVVSKVILTVVFFIIVTPVALLRKLLNKDSLQLKSFKKNTDSVMKTRDHVFIKADIEQPF